MSTEQKMDFGLIGLGVMGRNFVLNVAEKGFSVCGLDRDPQKVQQLQSERNESLPVQATTKLGEFVVALREPRKIMLLVPAGAAVDAVLDTLVPLLEPGDCIADGGNSHFRDTERRITELQKHGIHFLGVGVSGGSSGARKGPSIMPGGAIEAYMQFRPIFEAAAAKHQGRACTAYIGPGASGNYVKMVHNGIEYGLMELIAETYALLKHVGKLSNQQLSEIFAHWDTGKLRSFLMEITAAIFQRKDPLSTGDLIDSISDQAQQKGTGKWTSQHAMDLGIPIPTIDAAVSMRGISASKDLRKELHLSQAKSQINGDSKQLISDCENALYFGFMISYAQGMHQLTEASRIFGYQLNHETISRIWSAGCIIRSDMLNLIAQAYAQQINLPHLLLDAQIGAAILEHSKSARCVSIMALKHGIPAPGLQAAMAYFDAMRTENLHTQLIQAQRDYFGSHTYQRNDRSGNFHTNWEE